LTGNTGTVENGRRIDKRSTHLRKVGLGYEFISVWLTLWLLPYGCRYKAFCARPG